MKTKKTFFLLLATFIIPIFLGSLLYWLNPKFSNTTVNYGQLITPVIPINDKQINWVGNNTLIGKWTIAYKTNYCRNTCLENLKTIKTLHILMNDKMNRFQRVVFTQEKVSFHEFIQAKTSLKLPQNKLLLIDPLGNLMMSYEMKNIVIKQVIKDFNRLLKYSRIG